MHRGVFDRSRLGTGGCPAFTLIEMLVVISIIVVVTSLSVSALSVFLRGQNVKAGGRIVQTTFLQARQLAATKRVMTWLDFNPNTHIMTLWEDDGNGQWDDPEPAAFLVGKPEPLPRTVEFDTSANSGLFNGISDTRQIGFFPDGRLKPGSGTSLDKAFTPDATPGTADIILLQKGQTSRLYMDVDKFTGKVRKLAFRVE